MNLIIAEKLPEEAKKEFYEEKLSTAYCFVHFS